MISSHDAHSNHFCAPQIHQHTLEV